MNPDAQAILEQQLAVAPTAPASLHGAVSALPVAPAASGERTPEDRGSLSCGQAPATPIARTVTKCSPTAPWQVRCIQAHIAANMRSAIRTADLAAIMGFSSCRIRRVIKDHFGCTPHQYLMRRRVERTQRLLLISDDPLGQIAAECGFVSQSHFSNVFHKMVGERPGRWRRSQAGRNS